MVEVPITIYLFLVSGPLIFFIGFYTWFKERTKESLILFLLTIAQSCWAVLNFFLWKSCGNNTLVEFWDRLIYIPSIFLAPLMYHFSIETCSIKEKWQKNLLYFSYFLAFVFIGLSRTDYFVKDVFYYQWGCHTIAQTAHHFWLFSTIFFISIAIFNILKTWVKTDSSNSRFKNKLFYILIAYFAYFLNAFAALPAYKIGIYPFGYLGLPLFTVIIAYAITEKQLFAPALGTYILVAAILIFLATVLVFPMVEIGIGGRLILFFIMAYLCFLLLNYTRQEQKIKENLEKSYNELKQLDETKTMFLNLASHQLRTPLSSMKGYLELALSGNYGKVEGKAREFIESVKRSNEKEINLVNDLLDLNKLQTGKLQFSFQNNVQLEDIIEEVVNEFQPEAQKYNLYLKFNKPQQPLPKITADPQKLRQVILNLIDNSLKYTEKGKGGTTINLQLKTENQQPKSILTIVQDTGMGMTPQEKEKLFQLFERSKDATSAYPSGVGIGLYFASEIVKAHNGKIWAESQGKGQGSTFYVELPVK